MVDYKYEHQPSQSKGRWPSSTYLLRLVFDGSMLFMTAAKLDENTNYDTRRQMNVLSTVFA